MARMAGKDYYETLGVDRKATKDEIHRAYRKLARQLHPDVNPDNPQAKERFLEVKEAYEVLSNDEKRRRYDRYGQADFTEAGPGGGGFRWSSAGGGQGFGGIDLEDLFGSSDVFRDIFGGGRVSGFPGGAEALKRKGQDIRHEMHLSFEQAVGGVTTEIELAPAPGSGPGGRRERIEVKIPPGVADGSKIRVKGKGNPGAGGGPPGDLFVITRVGKHPYFRREGADLYLDLPLTIVEATLGTKVTIPTLDGSASLVVPPGTGSGRRLRLRGKGVRNPKGTDRGNLYAVVQIVPPKDVDQSTRELLKKLADKTSDDPRADLGWKL